MKQINKLIRALGAAAIVAALISRAQAAPPVANAGADITVADYDGDESVTLRLDASASADADGDIVSHTWTWPGGSASGQITEGVFPATNTPVTVTLTVTDAQANASTDTLVVAAYQSKVALFEDLGSQGIFSYPNPTIAGNTLILNTVSGLQGIYRRNSGVWNLTPATGIDFNQFAVDANTVFGGNFYSGTNLAVMRYNGTEWVNSPLTLSAPIMPQNEFFFPYNFAADPQTVVVADPNNGLNGYQSGRVFVYDWTGDNLNFATELTPPGGFAANDQWGQKIAVEGNLMVVASNDPFGFNDELNIYRKISGNWTFEQTLTGSGGDFIAYNLGIRSGKILVARYNGSSGTFAMVVIENINSTWVQTNVGANPFGFPQFLSYAMNDDGLSFAAGDNTGRFYLFKKGTETSTWAGSSVSTSRLLTRDLSPTNETKVTDFSNGLIAISSDILGKARIIDTTTRIDPINVEPIANAGSDITTTSFDGSPVRVFLNGAASRDLNYGSSLSAVWSWPGGSANGLQTFANIPASVTSIELKITDNQGAISRDTIQIDIDRPPVIDAGPDVRVVDTDGNGNVRIQVHGVVVSQSNPILSWNWRWPGGTLNSQSGTITLGEAVNGKTVTLEAIDSRGLVGEDQFTFLLTTQSPRPAVLQAADAAAQDQFGRHVAIGNDTSLVSAPGVRIEGDPTGATYLAENVNNAWQQLSLDPGTKQGTGVLIDGDTAFVGAANLSVSGLDEVGGVFIYERQSGSWNQTGLLTPPPPLTFNSSSYMRFGDSLAKSGNWLIIGAPGENNTPRARDGSSYLFEKTNGIWTFRQKIISPDAENFGGFGKAVAISGESLVVTSNLYQGSYDYGVGHIFTKGPSQWNFALKTEGNMPPFQFTSYGSSVAMTDSEVLIGAPREFNDVDPSGNGQGVVYRYSKNNGIWAPNGYLRPTAFTNTAISLFGTSMFIKDDILAVGAPGDASFVLSGRVHVFKMGSANWEFIDDIQLLAADDPSLNFFTSNFGTSVSHDGNNLIVGAPNATTPAGLNAGKAYIFPNYAALSPGGNHEPLANAGPDLNVTDTMVRDSGTNEITEPLGSEMVTLDADASTDQENAIVSYEWTWPGGSASGVDPSARFPVGTTIVTLTVSDALGVVSSDTVSVTVSLAQTTPSALPVTAGNSLTLDLFSSLAKWRLSSEFMWHGDNETAFGVVDGATYQVEIIPYPGSTEVMTTFVTTAGSSTTEFIDLEFANPPTSTGTISFPETSQGYSWRLVGESTWRNVTDDGDDFAEDIEFTLPAGMNRVEFKPVPGFTTPQTRVVTVVADALTPLDWAEYLRINSFDPARTFEVASDTTAPPYPYIGMIRSPLGRGTGTVVAERVVLTAAHLLFDANGLQWADTQWFSRQKQGERQAPPIIPRGVLYQTSYAKLIAPDSVEGSVANLPEDPQQVDFAVLYFSDETTWDQGSANFLQSTGEKNWLVGNENKHAIGYPQRSQQFENRGKMFTKQFSSPLASLGSGLYETTAVFGDGGASGSALFVQPAGGSNFYPAAILLAGQGRAVYRVIDEDITRMIKDGEDAATGNDDVLNNDSSLLTFDGLGSLTTVGVQVFPAGVRTAARWTITPVKGASSSNMVTTKQIAFNEKWSSYTISFSAISGYRTPAPLRVLNGSVVRNTANIHPFTYTAIVRTTTPSPLDIWKETNQITNLLDDGDNDGMNALIEYALDRNPGAADYLPPIKVSEFPLQTVFPEYEVYVSYAAEGIFYHVKASNSLDRSNAVTLATFTSDDGPSAYLTVTDTQPFSASPTRFAWVEIEVPSDP